MKSKLLLDKIVAIDTETTGLDTRNPKVQTTHISWWNNTGKGTSFSIDDTVKKSKLASIANDTNITKIFFNAKFDIRMLSKVGINIRGPVIDVLLMAQMALPEDKNKKLKHLAKKYLKDLYLEEIRLKQWQNANKVKVNGKWVKPPIGTAPRHIVEPYNLKDSRMTMELFYFLSAPFDKYNLWPVLEREMLLMKKVVIPMEDAAVHIDESEVDRLRIATRKEIRSIKDKLLSITKDPLFNPNSPAQVVKHLYSQGAVALRFSKKTGKPSADAIALLDQPSKFGTLISKYRKINKAETTYLKHFNKPLLHVSFNQGGTRTGRFSCSGPNLQNIPRPDEDSLLGQMKRCFIATPGNRLVFIDYEQIELKLTAHFSQEPHMLEAISKGQDLHGITCKILFNKNENSPDWKKYRYIAKTLNFAIVYGVGTDTFRGSILKNTNGEMRLSIVECARYINDYKAKHPMVVNTIAKEVAKTGGVVNHYGRFMEVNPYKSYVGVNYKIQGSAADLIKQRMLRVSKQLQNRNTKLILQVHDELAFDMPATDRHLIPDIVATMEEKEEFTVPLTCKVSIGKNWFDLKELKI
jgi:DNA polymerase-1